MSNSREPTADFKTGAAIIAETVEAIKNLSSVYKEVGLAGFLTISGGVIGVLTILLSFLTGTGETDTWHGGITLEEILFVALSISLVILGVILSLQRYLN